ncbi:MAG: hypothetical protein HY363_02260 [Candidatus Aenigmarchaeota archaeon]|nr:hypothetical protein [Candidatus Aenigmarchaeota archaeon]
MADIKNRVLIALDYDFTVSESVQQEPLFKEFFDRIRSVYPTYRVLERVEKLGFNKELPVWGLPVEVKDCCDYFKVSDEQQYKTPKGMGWMQQMLFDKDSIFEGKLTLEKFREVGQKGQVMSPGIPDGLWDLKKRYAARGVDVHFAIISIGLKEIIEASPINDIKDGEHLIDAIYGGEFYYDASGSISRLAYCANSFDKTKGLMQIVKGSPDLLDKLVPRSNYQFDYQNIIVVGDGFSDISYFSYARQEGGIPIAVYKLNDVNEYKKTYREVGERVDAILPRDYRPGSRTVREFDRIITRMVDRQCRFSQSLLHEYKRQRIKDEPTILYIEKHLGNCTECKDEGAYGVRFVPPA